jgi:outer membrane protein
MKGFMGMRVFAVVLSLSVTLVAALTHAQAPAQGAKPASPPPAAQTPAPRPQTQTPPPAQQPAVKEIPFKDGFKYAWVDIQRIAERSKEGQDATKRVNDLREKLQRDLTERQKTLQGNTQKLEREGSLLSDEARNKLQSDIERQTRELQRSTEDAQQEVERAIDRLRQEFMVKLDPVIKKVAEEKNVDMIFNGADSGLVFARDGMDLTADVIRAFDAGGGAKPAAGAAAPAPAATTPAAPAKP